MSNSEEFIGQLVAKYGKKRESLMPILQDVVDNFYYLNEERMVSIAKALDISTADVYGTASFYSFLNTTERGKYAIRVCQTIICDMKRKEDIIDAITELIGIKPGETSHDGKFTLEYTNCLGWCHKGPAMLINDEVYTELTPENVKDILLSYMKK
ncbi:MAG TPA: NAD(P)H-dependent oxidoreductase subunit E [Bacteroidales bacterium]|jgi:NADH:ubiquinone oxidoreductase subunit E|nr:NAD(P)H-dependent oxidoreductase subunit E [Bacteroidales bacterium]HPE40836.1 NAD(P)H-dependent oxidoreductase subunit E [Bacteroidales bacterium]